MTHAAVAKVAETGGSKVLEVADIQVDPAKPAAGNALSMDMWTIIPSRK